MSQATLSPYWPTPSLMTSLANAGFGPLAGNGMHAVRSVLDALVRSLDYKTGSGFSTAPQIAERAGGISERWTRRCLEFLERIGLITWTREGVIAGAPSPSHFRIIKAELVRIIELARPAHSVKTSKRRASTLERIRAARLWFTKSKKFNRVSRSQTHAELSSSPTHPKGWTSPRGASPRPVENSSDQIKETTLMKIPCAHSDDARTCHKCVTLNTPPAGYVYDFSTCQGCYKSKAGHDLMVRGELAYAGTAHAFEPQLRRLAS